VDGWNREADDHDSRGEIGARMNSAFSGSQFVYLIIAFVVLGLSFAGIVWVGKMIRGELGASGQRGANAAGLAMLEQISPAMMKEAIAKGLVVPSQLASMTEAERMFLFGSLKQKLAAAQTAPGAPGAVTAPVAAPAAAAAPPPPPPHAPKPAAPIIPADLPAGMAALLNAEKFRAWCPMCGTELQLPAFPPLLARCTSCGMKSAIRQEEGGRYVVIVSPPPKL
jgi:hypothetical protein